MKVKIGDRIYDSWSQPIMIILEDSEKKAISNMGDKTKFCSFPDSCSPEEIRVFMKTTKSMHVSTNRL